MPMKTMGWHYANELQTYMCSSRKWIQAVQNHFFLLWSSTFIMMHF